MRVLVTGASGQVARCLADLDGRSGHEVIALGRPELDLARPATMRHAIETIEPHCVVNAAAYTAVDKAEEDEQAAFDVNAAGAGELARITAAAKLPLVHISTDYVFDGEKSGRYGEDDPVNPLGAYGRSKAEGEHLVRLYNPDSVVLRTCWVYSPYGRNFVKTMLRLGSERDEIRVVADQTGCPTSAADIAGACLTIAGRLVAEPDNEALRGIFHYAGADVMSWADFATAILARSGDAEIARTQVVPIPSADYPTPAKRPANSALDCSRYERTFAEPLPPFEPSLKRALERLREQD